MKCVIIIPARYASSRFPGKPLALLGGMTVIERVYKQSRKIVSDVYVATDDDRIKTEVERFGGNVIMTRSDHRSGTDRIAEAVLMIKKTSGEEYDVVINVQGDEPFIHSEQIQTVIDCFEDPNTQIATLCKPFGDKMEGVTNVNSPKVVINKKGFAMYFSRSVIPFVRDVKQGEWSSVFPYMKHIGLYAYKNDILQEITSLPQSMIEKAESLEQLRWLYNGYNIKVGITTIETIGIDTPDDLRKAEKYLEEHNGGAN